MLSKRSKAMALCGTGILAALCAAPGHAQVFNNTSRGRAAVSGGYQPLTGSNTGPWAYRPLSSGWTGLNGTNTGPWAYRPLSSGWKPLTSGYAPPSAAYRTVVPANPSPQFNRKKKSADR